MAWCLIKHKGTFFFTYEQNVVCTKQLIIAIKQQGIPVRTYKAFFPNCTLFQSHKSCVFMPYQPIRLIAQTFLALFLEFSESRTVPYKENQPSEPSPSLKTSISKLKTVRVPRLSARLFTQGFRSDVFPTDFKYVKPVSRPVYMHI
jgi:hypothetical protein